jgi:hypothetical protein
MNIKRYVVVAIVVWVALFILEYILHGVVLTGFYRDIEHTLRPANSMPAFFAWVLLGEVILAFGFCYIFVKGYENRGIAEGVRYGLLIGITFGVSTTLINYAVHPIPGGMAVALIVGYAVEMGILGIIAAAIYKPA